MKIKLADKNSLFKKFGLQLSIYSFGELIVTISSIISFPIFTRVFSKDDYGIMNVVGVSMGFAEMLASGGLRNSVLRLYGEWKQKKNGVLFLYSTTLTSTIIMGVAVITVIYCSMPLLERILKNSAPFLLLALALILFRVVKRIILTIYRAEEKTITFVLTSVVDKYFGMALCLLWVISLSGGLRGFYKGLLIAEGSVFLFLFLSTFIKFGPKLIRLHRMAFIEVVKFGLPLLAGSLSASLVDFTDRFFLNYFLGPASVATLAVGYNIVGYIKNIPLVAIENAVVPISSNSWAENKYEETHELLYKFLQYSFIFGVPTAFGLYSLAPELIDILASSKYAQSQIVVPFAAIIMLLEVIRFPIISGLYFYKKTLKIAGIFFISALLNIGLDILLIPAYGIVGAALVSTLANSFILIAGGILSRRYFKIHIPYLVLFRSISFSIIMYVAIIVITMQVSSAPTILMLLLKFGVGLLTYALLTLFWYWKGKGVISIIYDRVK